LFLFPKPSGVVEVIVYPCRALLCKLVASYLWYVLKAVGFDWVE
jgi:hypothetical protein